MNFEKTLGERISDELESRGWTQREFSVKVGCYESDVSRWVNDSTRPQVKYRRKIKQIFGWT